MALSIEIKTWCEIFSHAQFAARCKCQRGVSRKLSHIQTHTECCKWCPVPPEACSTWEEGQPFLFTDVAEADSRLPAAHSQGYRQQRNRTQFNCQGKLNHCFTFSQCRPHYHNILYVPWTWPSKPRGWVNVQDVPLTLSTTGDFHLCTNWPIMWDRSWCKRPWGRHAVPHGRALNEISSGFWCDPITCPK